MSTFSDKNQLTRGWLMSGIRIKEMRNFVARGGALGYK
jgi:hypothetical protein